MLTIRGWKATRPPRGNLLWKNEYRDFPELLKAFEGRGKQGHGGDAYPDFVLFDPEADRPILIGEAKADSRDLATAVKEAEQYSMGFIESGRAVLAAGIAGDSTGNIGVEVGKWFRTKWRPIEYREKPIHWLPTPEEAAVLLEDADLADLQPRVPSPEILAKRGDEINRTLRECKIQDALRPAIMGAFMLALWQSKGSIRNDPEYILSDINEACNKAFLKAGKEELAKSLTVPVDNQTLASRGQAICHILRLLNITTLTSEHDYLGQLYETFFRFTGGNTIGQFFTPRHITQFMTELCGVSRNDIVVDPACGTGGFLIAALNKMNVLEGRTTAEINSIVKKHLRGFETEPITAALCVANMILRGDGKTGIVKGNCFTDKSYPEGEATVVLGNPPFPHKKTDEPAEHFVDRGLDALHSHGHLAMIVPGSLLVKNSKRKWRAKMLRENTLTSVITLPADLFQPYASSTTAIIQLERGVPHSAAKQAFFAHIENDGFRLKKNTRIPQDGSQLPLAVNAYEKHSSLPGRCSWSAIKGGSEGAEWAPGGYIAATWHDEQVLRMECDNLIRSLVAFTARYAPDVARLRQALARDVLIPKSYSHLAKRKPYRSAEEEGTIGSLFDIYYGQRELHNKENLSAGDSLVVSSSGTNNGCYGFFDFDAVIKPPFVTVPSTGSIAEAFVQLWPCGVTDDCLILVPRKDADLEDLFIAAAVLRLERWRFNYGRKATPGRIAPMRMDRDAQLREHIRSSLKNAKILMLEAEASLKGDHDAKLARFAKLAKQWRRETRHISSVAKMTAHPAYLQIIGMGNYALPLLLEELKENPDHWLLALNAITGEDPAPVGATFKEAVAAWLSWGRSSGAIE